MVKRDQQSDSPGSRDLQSAPSKGRIDDRSIATHSFPSCRAPRHCMLGHAYSVCAIQHSLWSIEPVEGSRQPATALRHGCQEHVALFGITDSKTTSHLRCTVLEACLINVCCGPFLSATPPEPARPAANNMSDFGLLVTRSSHLIFPVKLCSTFQVRRTHFVEEIGQPGDITKGYTYKICGLTNPVAACWLA